MRQAINMAWEHGGADFQSRFDKPTSQAIEMKKGAGGAVITREAGCRIWLRQFDTIETDM
jgi:hypothetical protein